MFASSFFMLRYYVSIRRDVELTEKLDYSSAVALQGYSLFLAIIRAFNVRLEAARVMVAAPIFAFTITHILYLNFYEFDYGKHIATLFIVSHTNYHAPFR